MARELTTEQQAVIDSDSFEYVDTVEIRLPWSNDPIPIVIRAAASEIEMLSFDFQEFVYQSFTAVFARVPTAAEESTWVSALETAFDTSLAALIAEADSLIDSLFVASEYTNRNRTNDQFVTDLYLAYMGRIPDAGGKAFWVSLLSSFSRDTIRNDFINASTEFADRIGSLNRITAFEPDIIEMGQVNLTDGRSQDGCDISLQNLSNTYSVKVAESTRRLHPAPAVVKRAFKISDGSYEPDTLITGNARFNSVDGQSAKVTIESDMSRRGLDVIIPVTQRCRHVYKGPGCDSMDPSPTCSRIFDDATNGCASKDPAPRITDVTVTNNQPSFGGVPPFAPSGTTDSGLPDSSQLPPNGWPDDVDPDEPLLRRGRTPLLGGGELLI